MKRESSKECSVFFCWKRKAIGYEIVFRGIQQSFLHGGPQNEPVLEFIHGSKVLEDFSGTFFTLWSRKITFLKGHLCMYKSQTFYKFCRWR